MIGLKPASSQLDVVHHCLGISMDCFLGNWQAHVRVDSVFRGVWEKGNPIPIKAWTVIDEIWNIKISFLILNHPGILNLKLPVWEWQVWGGAVAKLVQCVSKDLLLLSKRRGTSPHKLEFLKQMKKCWSVWLLEGKGEKENKILYLSAWHLSGHSRCERWDGHQTQPEQTALGWLLKLRMDPLAKRTEDGHQRSGRGSRVPLRHTDQVRFTLLPISLQEACQFISGLFWHLSSVRSDHWGQSQPHRASLGRRW